MTTETTTKDLAVRMVNTLPGWGLWAKNVRDYDTPYGKIGFRQASILWELLHGDLPEEDQRPTAIARRFGIQNSAVTKSVEKLVEGGYLLREINPIDRRRYQLTPTQKGIDISNYVQTLCCAPLQEALEQFDDDEIEQLSQQIETIAGLLDRIRHASEDGEE